MRKFRSNHHERKPKQSGENDPSKSFGSFVDNFLQGKTKQIATNHQTNEEANHEQNLPRPISSSVVRAQSVLAEKKCGARKRKMSSVIEEVVNKMFIQKTMKNNQRSEKIIEDTIVTILQSKMSVNPKRQYARDQEIQIQDQNQELILWLGQLYTKCCSAAFSYFIKGELTYRETKTFCCEQILKNLLIYMKSKNVQPQDMKTINSQSIKILSHLCNKYPRTDIVGVNKKLKEVVSAKINNWEDDQYDLFDKSKIILKLHDSGQYSEEIMKFLNYLISLPYKEQPSGLTLYKRFQKVMNKIFSVIYEKNSGRDLEKVVNADGKVDINSKLKDKKTLTEQEIQYMEKVKSYTNIAICAKISENTHIYRPSEISSGVVKITNPSVARILDKWTSELKKKFDQAKSAIIDRVYRFKGSTPGTKHKVPEKQKQNLFQLLQEKKKQLDKFIIEIEQNICELCYTLAMAKESDVSSLKFIPQSQRELGQFAVKMTEASSEYFIMVLNKQIHLLLEAIEDLKKNWVSKNTYTQSPFYQQLNISLVTFKIGDLMRCRIVSNEEEIIRVLDILKSLSENWENNEIKIIQVKDRLETGNRDVLINFMFDGICPCEIQLACASNDDEKQTYFDKFNHFLYQIKRAYLGPIMEMSEIWTHHESKVQTFVQAIKAENVVKNKKREKKQWPYPDFNLECDQYTRQIFPFVCSFCQIFYPGQKIFYWDVKWKDKYICGTCTEKKLTGHVKERGYFIFEELIKWNRNFMKTLDYLVEIKTEDQIENHDYFVYVPIQSRKISPRFVKKIRIKDDFAFVWTQINEGGIIDQKICSVTYQHAKTHLQEYAFFTWNLPFEDICINYKNRPSTQLLRNQLSALKEREERDGVCFQCTAMKISEDNYYYIPIFTQSCSSFNECINKQRNKEKIIKCLGEGKQIIQINKSQVTSEQFQLIQIPLKLKMNHLTKEMYLNENKLKSIFFISNMLTLKIFHAMSNQIEEIPELPEYLEDINLTDNKLVSLKGVETGKSLKTLHVGKNAITKISNIQKLQKLENLYLYCNKIEKIENLTPSIIKLSLNFNKIQKIENLETVPNLNGFNIAGNNISNVEHLSICRNLKVVLLNKNKIKCLKGLQSLSKLQNMHLSYNLLDTRFKEIEYQTHQIFQNLYNLKRIHIKFNEIHSISTFFGIDTELANVRELVLENNKIKSISRLYKIFPELQILNLSHNNLTEVSEIMNIITIKHLNLSHNSLETLPEEGWDNFFDIRYFNISNNKITKIPEISHFHNYEQIDLSHNEITEVGKMPVYHSSLLNNKAKMINFSNNKLFIKKVPEEIIAVLGDLQHNFKLDVRNNKGVEKIFKFVKKQKQYQNLLYK